MGERFNKQFGVFIKKNREVFPCEGGYCDMCPIEIKRFIQSEIDLAVANREKEIVGILEESKDGSDGDVVLDYIINIITAK